MMKPDKAHLLAWLLSLKLLRILEEKQEISNKRGPCADHSSYNLQGKTQDYHRKFSSDHQFEENLQGKSHDKANLLVRDI